MWCGAILSAVYKIKIATRTVPCGLTKFQTATAPRTLKTAFCGAVRVVYAVWVVF